jgi:hypothetical protein
LIGLGGIAASVAVARHLASNPPQSKAVRNFVDSLSGCGLSRAIRQFDEIERFADE